MSTIKGPSQLTLVIKKLLQLLENSFLAWYEEVIENFEKSLRVPRCKGSESSSISTVEPLVYTKMEVGGNLIRFYYWFA